MLERVFALVDQFSCEVSCVWVSTDRMKESGADDLSRVRLQRLFNLRVLQISPATFAKFTTFLLPGDFDREFWEAIRNTLYFGPISATYPLLTELTTALVFRARSSSWWSKLKRGRDDIKSLISTFHLPEDQAARCLKLFFDSVVLTTPLDRLCAHLAAAMCLRYSYSPAAVREKIRSRKLLPTIVQHRGVSGIAFNGVGHSGLRIRLRFVSEGPPSFV